MKSLLIKVLHTVAFLLTLCITSYGQMAQATIKPDASQANCVEVYFKIDQTVTGYPGSATFALSIPEDNGNPDLELKTLAVSSLELAEITNYSRDEKRIYVVSFTDSSDDDNSTWNQNEEYLLATVCFVDADHAIAQVRMEHYTRDASDWPFGFQSFWYMQMNGGSGDITNMDAPFYIVEDMNSGSNGNSSEWDHCYLELNDPIPLPVTLLNFTATAQDKIVYLDWETVEERNASHFIVERSRDGLKWEFLDKAQAQSRNKASVYRILDSRPYMGLNYYRLRMVDQDNSFTTSEVRKVVFSNSGAIVLYPNPATDRFFITGIEALQASAQISIYNEIGAQIWSGTMSGASLSQQGIDISTFTSGAYHVRVISEEITEVIRLVKQ